MIGSSHTKADKGKPIFRSWCSAFLVAAFLGSCTHPSTKSIPLHPIIARAKETSLYSQRVDWDTLNRDFVSAIEKDASGSLHSKNALRLLINALGDKHAAFRSASSGQIIAQYSGAEDSQDLRKAEFVNSVINDVDAQFSYKLLSPEIGYLKVVGIGPGEVDQQANAIRSGISKLAQNGAKRWVLDLRYNGGGNMNPMIAGLAPLLTEGNIGGSVNSSGAAVTTYQIARGAFFDTGRLVVDFQSPAPAVPETPKIAILLSRYTISSGELVAIAFKKQPNTRFFGEPTAGYTTVTGYDKVSDDVIMLLSLSVFTDRAGQRYDKHVEVDEYIEFQNHEVPTKDAQIAAAVAWLNTDAP